MWAFADSVFQRNGPFHLGYQIVNTKVFIFLYYSFYTHGINSDDSSFILGIKKPCVFYFFFFLVSLANSLSSLLIFSNNKSLALLFFSHFLIFNLIYWCIKFSSACFTFILLFFLFTYLNWKLRLLILDLSFLISIYSTL